MFIAAAAVVAMAGPVSAQIATGSDSGVDGHLSIFPDEFGSWASATFAGLGDTYKPAGMDPMEATFTSGFFLFTPFGQRELLTDNPSWQGTVGPDASLDRMIVSFNVLSDTTGNGVNDTANSEFRVFGTDVDLSFEVTQQVRATASATSFLEQTFVITNDGPAAISFSLVRAYDGDLLWPPGGFENDEVGTTMHSAGLGPYVFMQEAANPAITGVTLSSLSAATYYGGKNGVDPDGAGGDPAFGFGTDTQIWNNFGIPGSWQNFIAGVGANMNGVSGTEPPGSIAPQDGFIGLGFDLDLAAGESTTITVLHTYGANQPIPPKGGVATAVGFSFVFGTHLSGDLDSLRADDRDELRGNSQFGFSAQEPNIIDLLVDFQGASGAAAIDVTVETRLNNPGGTARLRVMNYTSNAFEEVATFPVGQTSVTHTVENLDAADFVNAAGEAQVSVREFVIATFAASGFEAAFDLAEVSF